MGIDATKEENRGRRKWKTLWFLLIIYAAVIVVFEVGARAVYFVMDGFNPYYITYGFVPDSEWNSAELDGYTKFQPGTERHQQTDDGVIAMRINRDGFRGADFVRPKPEGTLRVVTLGASSTFGYYNQDHQTYPARLETILEVALGAPVDVYNLGIPEMRLNNILALSRAELASLQPDIVTLYAGANNAIHFRDRGDAGFLYRTKDKIAKISIGWRAISPLVRNAYFMLTRVLNKDLAGLPSVHTPVVMSPSEVEALVLQGRREFRHDLLALSDLVDSVGAQFIVSTQSYAPKNYIASDHLKEWRSYWDDVAYFKELTAKEQGLVAPLSAVLVHAALMEELVSVAQDQGLSIVPGIEVLDGDRAQNMASFVHLTPKGNELLAQTLAEMVAGALKGPETDTLQSGGATSPRN